MFIYRTSIQTRSSPQVQQTLGGLFLGLPVVMSPVVLVVTSSVLVVAVSIISGVFCVMFLCCVVGVVVSGVMMVSGGQVELLALKVTSARCTQLEVEGEMNTKVITGQVELTV